MTETKRVHDAQMINGDNWSQVGDGATYNYSTGEITGGYSLFTMARALSWNIRYNGQTYLPWSVAAHGCFVSEILAASGLAVPLPVVLLGLHHDDEESLVGDMVTQFKNAIGREVVKPITNRAQIACLKSLGIVNLLQMDANAWRVVAAADMAACEAERRVLFRHYMPWEMEKHLDLELVKVAKRIFQNDYGNGAVYAIGPSAAERFMSRHHSLVQKITQA